SRSSHYSLTRRRTMSIFTKTALVALVLAGTIGGALAQQADQTSTPQTPAQPAPVRSRVATRQILVEPAVQVAAVTPAADLTVTPAAAPQVVAGQAAPVAPAPDAPAVKPADPKDLPPGIVRKGIEPQFGDRYGYGGYSPRYSGGYGYHAHYD